jgi:hypothetical protein
MIEIFVDLFALMLFLLSASRASLCCRRVRMVPASVSSMSYKA